MGDASVAVPAARETLQYFGRARMDGECLPTIDQTAPVATRKKSLGVQHLHLLRTMQSPSYCSGTYMPPVLLCVGQEYKAIKHVFSNER